MRQVPTSSALIPAPSRIGYSCGGGRRARGGRQARETLVMMNSACSRMARVPGSRNGCGQVGAEAAAHAVFSRRRRVGVAWVNANDDSRSLTTCPLFYANLLGVGHGGNLLGTQRWPAAAAVLAWLDWQLRGDRRAAMRSWARTAPVHGQGVVRAEEAHRLRVSGQAGYLNQSFSATCERQEAVGRGQDSVRIAHGDSAYLMRCSAMRCRPPGTDCRRGSARSARRAPGVGRLECTDTGPQRDAAICETSAELPASKYCAPV